MIEQKVFQEQDTTRFTNEVFFFCTGSEDAKQVINDPWMVTQQHLSDINRYYFYGQGQLVPGEATEDFSLLGRINLVDVNMRSPSRDTQHSRYGLFYI